MDCRGPTRGRLGFCCAVLMGVLTLAGCRSDGADRETLAAASPASPAESIAAPRAADFENMSAGQRLLIPLLTDAARAMDDAFWLQSFGNREPLLESIPDPAVRTRVREHYGPWDRSAGLEPFVDGFGPKPLGANLYPHGMTAAEFESAALLEPAIEDPYTLVRRNPDGRLEAWPYRRAFADQVELAAGKLRGAARLTGDPDFANYLDQAAAALVNDDYAASDVAWVGLTRNPIDVVIGPLASDEDRLFGIKRAFGAFVVQRDMEWAARLDGYATLLPEMQQDLPVPDRYKREMPGSIAGLGAYEVLYRSGAVNVGPMPTQIHVYHSGETITEDVERRLVFRDVARVWFGRILVPISRELVARDQLPQITVDASLARSMLRELARALGLRQTIRAETTVRQALEDSYATLDEVKADVLGLFVAGWLSQLDGAAQEAEGVEDAEEAEDVEKGLGPTYVTFMAAMLATSGREPSTPRDQAASIVFNFFLEQKAFVRDPANGVYRVDLERMPRSVTALAGKVLRLQGDGDPGKARSWIDRYVRPNPQRVSDLDRCDVAGIPQSSVWERETDRMLPAQSQDDAPGELVAD
jgi:hypothetical protein